MDRNTSRRFYNSKAWQVCRDSYISSVDGLCERCMKRGKVNPGYIVHHKIILNEQNIKNPNIALNHANLEYLCLECHNITHGKERQATAEGLCFDDDGNLIEA